jgi:hypothetical protein
MDEQLFETDPAWFEAAPGRLFVAPMGTETPGPPASGKFPAEWPDGWRAVGATHPRLCRATADVYAGSVGPLTTTSATHVRWQFGTALADQIEAMTTMAPLTGVRFMTGWQDTGGTMRLVADRCVLADGWVRLEGDPLYRAESA